MITQQTSIHSLDLNLERIKEEGIVILDNVMGLVTGKEPFVSPHFVISIAHSGVHHVLYDNVLQESKQGSVAVLYPNHELVAVSTSNDYLCSIIMLDAKALDDPMLQIINQLQYRYEKQPSVILDNHSYQIIKDVLSVMRETVNVDLPDRKILLARQLEFFLRLLTYYRNKQLNEATNVKRISAQFYANMKQYAHQHRDVGFYADLAYLTPKHFSAVIKQETGNTAAYWIHNHLIAEAKMLLHVRRDLTVQAIAFLLGFEEQTVFSRYFKREVGLSPTEFRENI